MRPALVSFALIWASSPAFAGAELTSDAGSADLRELEHRRSITLRPLWLEARDQHRFENRSRSTRQLIYRFDLPAGAAVTGIEVAGHGAVAIDSAAAIRALPAATSDAERSDLALLREIAPARYELTVYPIDPGTSIAAAITWVAPVALADGRVSARLPARGSAGNLAATRVEVRTAGWGSVRGLDDLTLGGHRRRRVDIPAGDRVGLAIGARARFARAGALDLRVAAVELDRGLHALAITGIAGPRLRSLGRYLHVVIVVDVSASMGRSGLEAAARIADAILAALPPETRVAVIPFDREARPLEEGFAVNDHRIRGRVAKALAPASIGRPRNGSNLGAALAAASALLDSREVRQLTRDARASGEPSAAVITISDQATPLELTPKAARARLGRFALAESVFFAVTVAPSGRAMPRPLAGALDDLVARSGGASFAVRPGEAARRAPEIARQLGSASQLFGLRARLGARELGAVELPDRLAPGSGFAALLPWAGPLPAGLVISAQRRTTPLVQTARRRRDRALEAALAPMLLRRLDPQAVAAAHRRAETRGGPSAPLSPEREARRQLARAGLRHPTVSRYLSLVIAHPTDRFAREQLAFARKWGTWLYRRAPTPAEIGGAIEHVAWRGKAAPNGAAIRRAEPRGTIGPKILRREIRDQLYRRIRGCYDRELRAAPRLRGSLTVRFEIAGGETRAVDITGGSISRSGLRRCVIEAGYQLAPPRAAGDDETVYVVRYPFRFRARGARGEIGEDDGSGKQIELDPDDPLSGID